MNSKNKSFHKVKVLLLYIYITFNTQKIVYNRYWVTLISFHLIFVSFKMILKVSYFHSRSDGTRGETSRIISGGETSVSFNNWRKWFELLTNWTEANRSITCLQCARSFASEGNLNAHIKIHTGENPFTCLQCGKSFPFKERLNVHIRIHTGEKTFIPAVWEGWPVSIIL